MGDTWCFSAAANHNLLFCHGTNYVVLRHRLQWLWKRSRRAVFLRQTAGPYSPVYAPRPTQKAKDIGAPGLRLRISARCMLTARLSVWVAAGSRWTPASCRSSVDVQSIGRILSVNTVLCHVGTSWAMPVFADIFIIHRPWQQFLRSASPSFHHRAAPVGKIFRYSTQLYYRTSSMPQRNKKKQKKNRETDRTTQTWPTPWALLDTPSCQPPWTIMHGAPIQPTGAMSPKVRKYTV